MDISPSNTDDITDAVWEAAYELGVSLEAVQCYERSGGDGLEIMLVKRIGGEMRKTSFNVSYGIGNLSDEDVYRRLTETAIQSLKNFKHESAIHMNVNGHELRFYLEDGFEAYNLTTGEEWTYRDEAHVFAGEMFSQGPEVPISTDMERGIPYPIKEKMMMWVVGWANRATPDDVFYLKDHFDDDYIEAGRAEYHKDKYNRRVL